MIFASLLSVPAAAQVLSVEARGPAVPCTRVEHVIEASQGTLVARVGKFMPEGFGRREAVGLLTDEELAALVAELEGLGAFALPPAASRSARTTYRVHLEALGKRHTFVVADPELRPDGRHWAVIERLRQAVESRTGEAEVQLDLLRPDEAGLVQVLTDVPAQVVVVGEGVRGQTPLRGLRLPVGTHTLEVLAEGATEPNRYEIRVDAGRTTSLKVALK